MKTVNRVLPGVIRKLFISWLFAAVVSYFALRPADRDLLGTSSLSNTSLLSVIFSIVACFLVLSVSEALLNGRKREILVKAERWLMPVLFAVLSFVALATSFAFPFLVAILVPILRAVLKR